MDAAKTNNNNAIGKRVCDDGKGSLVSKKRRLLDRNEQEQKLLAKMKAVLNRR
jgi:hypothetical protein